MGMIIMIIIMVITVLIKNKQIVIMRAAPKATQASFLNLSSPACALLHRHIGELPLSTWHGAARPGAWRSEAPAPG